MTTDEPMTSTVPTQTTVIPGMANDALTGSGNGEDSNTVSIYYTFDCICVFVI